MSPPGERRAAVVAFCNVSKTFGDVVAAKGLELEVAAGEFLSLLGPSGCGKTTALRMIAGFERPSEGQVLLDGQPVNDVPPYRRPVNMVFQHYALFPHLDVAGNIAYGLRQRRPAPSRAEIRERVGQTLEMVRLGGFERRRIWEMSGGQQQRVALARALINEPKVLLLDEPLAALDRKLRREMQFELQNLQRSVGITFVLVTHDQEEALSMSDRVCIMRNGRIVQVGTPRELYDRPSSRYVADFVGKSNFFDGVIRSASDTASDVAIDSGIVITSSCTANPISLRRGDRVSVSIRPEQMIVARDPARLSAEAAVEVEARVLNRIFLGEHTEYLLRNDALGEFLVLTPRQSELAERPLETGEIVHVACSRDAALVLRGD